MVIFTISFVFFPLGQKTNLNRIKNYVKIKDFKNVVMPSEDTELSEFNQNQKSD